MKVYIDDYKNVKIIKIKDWSVSFKYKEDYYLLHICNEDYETTADLHKRVVDNGKIIGLELISNCYSNNNVYGNFIRDTDEGKTYKQIDKDYFIRNLTKNKLVESYMDYDEYIKGLNVIDLEINKKREELREIEIKRREYIGS